MVNLWTFLVVLDAFGTRPSFFIRGSTELKSLIGGIFTTIVYVASVVALCYFSQELIFKDSPTVGTAKLINDHPGKITYPNQFFFMFTLESDYNPLVDESIYYPIGYIHKTKVNGGVTSTEKIPVKCEKCSKIRLQKFDFLQKGGYYYAKKDLTRNRYF